MVKFISIQLIKLYQIFISPRKGYRCAHSVLHGDTGCSGAVINILNNNKLLDCPKLIKERFSNCKLAYQTIQEEKKKDNKDKSNRCSTNKCSGKGCTRNTIGEGIDCIDFDDCGDCDVGSCDF